MKKPAGKNNNKPKTSYSEAEMKRYLGALNEMHGENLKAVKEGFDVLNRKLDEHSRVLDSHTEMLGNLMEDVSVLKDDMQIVKQELKKKVDYDEFLALVKRVNKLEKA